jgi:hypothetical protein
VDASLSSLLKTLSSSLSFIEVLKNMAKITRISYADYKKLKDCLARDFPSASRLARVLLEAFLFEDGAVTSDWFIREKICAKGAFTALRSRLISSGWLIFREDTRRYLAGKRLTPYIRDLESRHYAKMTDFRSLESIVTKKADQSALDRVAHDVQGLQTKMVLILKLLSELKSLQAPPPSAAAQKRSAELTDQLSQLLASQTSH